MRRFMSALLAVAAFLGAVGNVRVANAAAYDDTKWVVSITYQNVGNAPATVSMTFRPEGGTTETTINPLGSGTLAPGAGASLFVGSVSGLNAGFRGSGVVSANQPLVATIVQFSQTPGFKMRLLSNGMGDSDLSNQYLIATTLLNKFNRTTVFSVQNTEAQAIDATIRFYDADAGGRLASTVTHNIPAGSSKYVDMGRSADTGLVNRTVFNGSAIVTAVVQGGTTPANVVATANEYYTNRNVAASFEGLPLSRAANTIYLATGLCKTFGLDTFYAVQNASLTQPAQVTVTYRNTNGTVKTTDGPYTIGGGQKKSITTCTPNSGVNMTGFTGSATITSVGAPIVAIGKAQGTTGATASTVDVFTAFLGQPVGSSKLALPFVRWANDADFNAASNAGGRQRSFIAVQNLGTSTAKINVKYYDKVGALRATQSLTIPAGAKGNSDPKTAGALDANGMFGYYTDGSFGGAVTIEADASNPNATFIAINRVQHPGAGEDYNGMAVQ